MSTGNSLESRKNPDSLGYYIKDIQNMMHGMGDYAPLQESAILIESVVIQQLASALFQASENTLRKDSKYITPEDILFLFRKDKVKLHRLYKYLSIKDARNRLNIAVTSNETTGDPTKDSKRELQELHENRSKRQKMCQEFIESIDETGYLKSVITGVADPIKLERGVRICNMSMKLDTASYFQFAAARGASFTTNQNMLKFKDWIKVKAPSSYEGFKVSNAAYELLGYIAMETLAQIVDLTFLVRQDAKAKQADPFTRATPLFHATSKGKTDAKLVANEPPLTPAEIQEAVRRYWSPQLSPGGLFNRSMVPHLQNRLLAC